VAVVMPDEVGNGHAKFWTPHFRRYYRTFRPQLRWLDFDACRLRSKIHGAQEFFAVESADPTAFGRNRRGVVIALSLA
jgi:hypothetical protein